MTTDEGVIAAYNNLPYKCFAGWRRPFRSARRRRMRGATNRRPRGSAPSGEVVKSLDKGLDQNAMDAVKTWKFKPASKEAMPVPVKLTVEVNFKLF